jgi:hypothetical protein
MNLGVPSFSDWLLFGGMPLMKDRSLWLELNLLLDGYLSKYLTLFITNGFSDYTWP